MSYCALVVFRNDVAEEDEVFHNAYGFVEFVWNRLCDRYGLVKEPKPVYYTNFWPALWDKAPKLPLTDWEKTVLLFTYDHTLVCGTTIHGVDPGRRSRTAEQWANSVSLPCPRERLLELADALEKFQDYYDDGTKVCHLKGMAKRLRELSSDETVRCVGSYQVSGSLWEWFDDERTLEDEK